VAAKFTGLAGTKAEALIIEWLSHAGAEVAAEALGSTLKLFAAAAKSGKAPTQKEFEAATCDILFKLMGANFLKMLGGLESKAGESGNAILTGRMLPEWFNKYAKGQVPPKVQNEVMKTVAQKLNEPAAKVVFDQGVSSLKGKNTSQKLVKQGIEKGIKDKALLEAINKQVRDELKRRKCIIK
jgi:hypothetical protein